MPELPPPPPPPMSLVDALVDLCRRHRPPWATPARVLLVSGLLVLLVAGYSVISVRTGAMGARPELVLPAVGSPGDPGRNAGSSSSDDGDTGDTDHGRGDRGALGDDERGGPIAVHAAGAFVRPGLYRLPSDARVADLLDAAGGAAADASVDALNLAAKLEDGARVYLPRASEVTAGDLAAGSAGMTGSTGGGGGAAAGSASAGGTVDLNTATLEQLDSLPGVGPSTAQAILDYRRERGRFRSVDELLEVRGIGDAKLASMRSRVRV